MDCQDKNALDLFNRSYVECALWSADDIADEAKAKMTADCEAFMDANAEALKDYPAHAAGHDFWLTRNHHRTSFWEVDHVTQEQCDLLIASAHGYGECNLYVGDDGKIYV